jgi:hypothetical protein
MFRNQTSIAAQKAEGAWRQRSKSQQRPGSIGDINRSLSFGGQHAPQTGSASLAKDESRVSVAEKAMYIPIPPTSRFNDLSMSSRIGPDLHRLAYERFVYDYVVFETPHKPPGALSDGIYDFIPTLYQRAPDGSCLVMAVDAVAYVNFASRCNAPQAQALGEESLGKAIKLLQTAIADKQQAPTDEILCSVYLMGIYGV